MNFTNTTFYTNLANGGTFLFLAGALLLPSGYSWGAVVLLLLALIYLGFNRKQISMNPKFITYPVLIYFVATLVSYLIFLPEKPIQLDLAGRMFLGIAVTLFLSKKKLSLLNIAIGVALGAIFAFAIAYYQVGIAQTHLRAKGHIHTIMFGQISMLWGMLSLAGLLLLDKIPPKRHWLFALLFLAGGLGGTYASILSGSKGAWIVFPPALIIYFIVAWRKLALKYILSIVIMYSLLFSWIFLTENIVKQRSSEAITEIEAFEDNPNIRNSSIAPRLQMYAVGLLLFKDHPLLGVGRDAKNEEVEKLDVPLVFKQVAKHYYRFHNDYIDLAAFYGLLVLVPFLFLLGMPAWYFGRKLFSHNLEVKYLSLSGFLIIACYSIASLTDTLFQLNPGVMTYGFLIPIFGSQLWRLLNSKD